MITESSVIIPIAKIKYTSLDISISSKKPGRMIKINLTLKLKIININGKINFIGNPDERIKEDYLRILRYIRFFLNYSKQPL